MVREFPTPLRGVNTPPTFAQHPPRLQGQMRERGKGEGGEKGKGEEKGREGTPKGWLTPPMFQILKNTLDVARRLQSSVIGSIRYRFFSFWAPSDFQFHVPLNEDNDGQCWQQLHTHFYQIGRSSELPRVDTCRQWYTACTLFADG